MAGSKSPSPDVWDTPKFKPAARSTAFGNAPRTPRAWSARLLRLAAWTGIGLLLTASVVMFPVGLLTLPFAVAAFAYMATRRPAWPDVLGLLPGAAGFTAYVAYRNRDHQPCGGMGTSGVITTGADVSCGGGTSPEPWLAATALLLVVAVVTYALTVALERRRAF